MKTDIEIISSVVKDEVMELTKNGINQFIVFKVHMDEKQIEAIYSLEEFKNISIGYQVYKESAGKRLIYKLYFIFDEVVAEKINYSIIYKKIEEKVKLLNLKVVQDSNWDTLKENYVEQEFKLFNLKARIIINLYEKYIEEFEDIEVENNAKKILEKVLNYPIYSFSEVEARVQFIKDTFDVYTCDATVYALNDYRLQEHLTNAQFYKLLGYIFPDKIAMDKNYEKALSSERNSYTIGRLIAKSNDLGFEPSKEHLKNRKKVHQFESKLVINNIEKINLKSDYIEKDFFKKVLLSDEKTLVYAPTNSGKTTAIVEAMREITYQDNGLVAYIMAVPSIPLVESLANTEKGIAAYYGGMSNKKSVKEFVENELGKGTKIFVTTYDMTKKVLQEIHRSNILLLVDIIVDECHQITESCQFRKDAIQQLLDSKKNIKVGISGTPEPIATRSLFSKYIEINKKDNSINCDEYNIYEYHHTQKMDILNTTIEVIAKPLLKKEPVLLFVSNINSIDLIIKGIEDYAGLESIKVDKIVSKDKSKNDAYNSIVSKSEWPIGTDLIITTNLISEGISIINSKDAHIFILAAPNISPFFDKYLVRQSASRFRKDYASFNIIIKAADKDKGELYDYTSSIVTSFYFAETLKNTLNECFLNFSKRQKTKIVIGDLLRNYTVMYNEKSDEFIFNEFVLREKQLKLQAFYYQSNRESFVKDVGQMLNKKITNIHTIEYIPKKEEKKEKGKNGEAERQSKKKYKISKKEYEEFKKGSKLNREKLQDELTKENFHALEEVAMLLNYEDTVKVVENVHRNREINFFSKTLNTMNKLRARSIYHKGIETDEDKIINLYAKEIGITDKSKSVMLASDELKAHVESLSKKTSYKVSDLNLVIKEYFYAYPGITKRIEGKGLVKLKEVCLICPEVLSKKFGIHLENIKEAWRIYNSLNDIEIIPPH